jgi:hypothetical protein
MIGTYIQYVTKSFIGKMGKPDLRLGLEVRFTYSNIFLLPVALYLFLPGFAL